MLKNQEQLKLHKIDRGGIKSALDFDLKPDIMDTCINLKKI